ADVVRGHDAAIEAAERRRGVVVAQLLAEVDAQLAGALEGGAVHHGAGQGGDPRVVPNAAPLGELGAGAVGAVGVYGADDDTAAAGDAQRRRYGVLLVPPTDPLLLAHGDQQLTRGEQGARRL